MLREEDDVRPPRPALRGQEAAPGAAEGGLHLVGDEERAVLRRELAQGLDERRRERAHAALALDRLDDDRGHVVPRQRARQRVHVAEGDRARALDEGRERVAQVALLHERDRAEAAAVVRALEERSPGRRVSARASLSEASTASLPLQPKKALS